MTLLYTCDPIGIQTQDLQNRNLTLYSAKLRDLCTCLLVSKRMQRYKISFKSPHITIKIVDVQWI